MASIKLDLAPFPVPSTIQVVIPKPEGYGPFAAGDASLPLSEVDEHTLKLMCAEFTEAVLAKAKGANNK